MSKDIQKQDSLIMDTHIIKNDIINQILNDVRLRFEDSGEILLPQKRFIVLSIKKIKDTYDIKVSVIDYKYSNYFFDKNNYKGYFKQNGIVTFFWGDTDSFFSKKQNIKIEPLLNIKKPIGIIDIYEPFVFSYSIKNNLFTYLKSDHFALIHSWLNRVNENSSIRFLVLKSRKRASIVIYICSFSFSESL